ncbi:hypothetical protein BS78_10G108200, partial [Paspalum vaginatum]
GPRRRSGASPVGRIPQRWVRATNPPGRLRRTSPASAACSAGRTRSVATMFARAPSPTATCSQGSSSSSSPTSTVVPTHPAGVPRPSGSGGRATTAEKCAPGGPTAGDASRARATTEGPAPGATPSVRPQAPGGPTPGGVSGVETAPQVPPEGAAPDAQPQAPGSPMPEGVAAQGPASGAAPDARTSEPPSPA